MFMFNFDLATLLVRVPGAVLVPCSPRLLAGLTPPPLACVVSFNMAALTTSPESTELVSKKRTTGSII